jgi:ketosteroid isomerase-like protein
MSEENVEIIRRGYEHWLTTGEIRAHPDFVWDVSKLGWPDQQIYSGAEGAIQFNAEWADAWDGWEVKVEDYIDAGESVVVIVNQRGRSKATGIPRRHALRSSVDVPGRTGDQDADVREPARGPRSRGAVGAVAN